MKAYVILFYNKKAGKLDMTVATSSAEAWRRAKLITQGGDADFTVILEAEVIK